MLEWYTYVQMGVAALAAAVCLLQAVMKKTPNDLSMGLVVLGVVGLVIQVGMAIIAPLSGFGPSGDPLEYWLYLLVALALPIGAGFWALIDRTFWALAILALVELSLVVMLYRMGVIWGIWPHQLAA